MKNVDHRFFLGDEVIHEWKMIWSLSCPKFFSREMFTCSILMFVLIVRTLLSVWIASIHGKSLVYFGTHYGNAMSTMD